MNDDLINRQAATKFINECLDREDKLQSVEKETLLAVKGWIEVIPSADVRPVVRGKWEDVVVTWLEDVEEPPDAIASMLCSECKRFTTRVYQYGNPCDGMNFCPHCGAWMGGDAE